MESGKFNSMIPSNNTKIRYHKKKKRRTIKKNTSNSRPLKRPIRVNTGTRIQINPKTIGKIMMIPLAIILAKYIILNLSEFITK